VSYLPPEKPRDIAKASSWVPYHWEALARNDQLPPIELWRIWLLMGGRGSGKTRAGAEWVRAQVQKGARRIALIAPTYHSAREVMLEGESGLLSIGHEAERPTYTSSRRRLDWPNGAVGFVFSSEDPEALRGPQFEKAWADEFCAWSYPDATLSNLRLGLRLGDDPRLVVTTTPKPTRAMKALMAAKGVVISRAKTADNAANLAPSFLAAMDEAYGKTRLGRQELDGEFLEDLPGALWIRDGLAACLSDRPESLDKIIVAVDPPVTSGARADACGIIIAGLTRGQTSRDDKVYILHDGTVQGLSPDGWAARVLSFWDSYDADYVLVEVNQGGEMVSSILKNINPNVLVRTVYASRGKAARAEPVSALYTQGRVHHVRPFPELEDELASLGAEASIRGSKSPDRADALVWAVTDLLLGARQAPRIRQI
jgi:phage terminase large subunit-like protein